MRREIIETAKTVEEAINSACAKLGEERDNVEWEIIDLPKRGFLGLKNFPAKVKVWKEEPEPEPTPQPPRKTPSAAEQPKREQPKRAEAPAQTKKEQPRREQPKREPREEKKIELTQEVQSKIDSAIQYLTDVCAQMGMKPQFKASIRDGGICINVEGEGLGAMIGRRGETLDAMQYLAGLVANRLEGEYLRFTIDCGDYRTKRKATLEALAKKLSAQVLKTNIAKTLEPMNPFERRIIHATVSEIEGVSSTSVGEEPNRRVIITSPTARSGRGPKPSGSRGGRDRDSGRSGGGNRGGGPRRGAPPRRESRSSTQGGTINTLPQQQAAPTRPSFPPPPPPPSGEPKKTPESEAGLEKPLYAKLDLE